MTQRDFWGNEKPPDGVVAKVEEILKSDPGSRNNYKRLMALFWMRYDGLNKVLDMDTFERFVTWFASSATSPKTIQNRAMEIQRADPDLDANIRVREWRDKQGKAGRVT